MSENKVPSGYFSPEVSYNRFVNKFQHSETHKQILSRLQIEKLNHITSFRNVITIE